MMLNKMDRGKKVVKKGASFQLLSNTFFRYWGSRSSEASERATETEALRNELQQRIFVSAAMMAGKRKNRYTKGNLETRLWLG